MTTHLLTLADLHAAAPGVLSVIFGPDGDFEGAPRWKGPAALVVGGQWLRSFDVEMLAWPEDGLMLDLALDLRIPSVAARLAGLCSRVPFTEEDDGVTRIARGSLLQQVMQDVAWGSMRNGTTKALAALTLALAPRIAALKDAK